MLWVQEPCAPAWLDGHYAHKGEKVQVCALAVAVAGINVATEYLDKGISFSFPTYRQVPPALRHGFTLSETQALACMKQ